MIDLTAELLPAAKAGVIGLAVVGADRKMRHKIGHLVEWLPPVGVDCCNCTLLVGMEAELTALADGSRDILALPGLRSASVDLDLPVTAVFIWNEDQSHFLAIAMPDFAARQIELLLGSERRALRLMEQQLEAASSEVRFASLARTRLKLARDLHDTLVHSVMALLTQIRLIRHFLTTDPERVSDGLEVAEDAAISGLARARDAIARLRMPDEIEFTPDIDGMLSELAERTGAVISVDVDETARAGLARHGMTVQRILGEALRNIERHAKAHSVQLLARTEGESEGRTLVIEIRDDGLGFDTRVPTPGHFGLSGMSEFAGLVGGECRVESSPGKGAMVRVSLPLHETTSSASGINPADRATRRHVPPHGTIRE